MHIRLVQFVVSFCMINNQWPIRSTLFVSQERPRKPLGLQTYMHYYYPIALWEKIIVYGVGLWTQTIYIYTQDKGIIIDIKITWLGY